VLVSAGKLVMEAILETKDVTFHSVTPGPTALRAPELIEAQGQTELVAGLVEP
jgi:hypothetical protein